MNLKSRKNLNIKRLSFFLVLISFLALFIYFLSSPVVIQAEGESKTSCRSENEECNLGEGNFCCLGLLCVNEFGLPWTKGKCLQPASCPTNTPTPIPTSCLSPTPTTTNTPQPTPTPTPTSTLTPILTPTSELTPTSTVTIILTPTPTSEDQNLIKISLEKSNDKQNGASTGDIVQYTLRLTNIDRELNALSLVDNLPEGFVYQANSASVDGGNVSSVEPAITNDGKTLTWNWNFVPAPGVMIVTYKAKISDSNQAGTYTDFAYAKGMSGDQPIESNVAKSDVVIGPVFDFSASVGGVILGAAKEEGEILGAVLPATGTENMGYLSVAFFMIGSGILIKRKVKEK